MKKKIDPVVSKHLAEVSRSRKNFVGGFKDPETAKQAGAKGRETQRLKREAAINNLQHEANKESEAPKGA